MLEFLVFSGVTNGFRSGNELLRYEKLLFSAKKTDFAVTYSGTSAGEGGIYNTVNLSVYHYGGNNPVKYVDLDGNWIETGWDVTSLAAGIYSFVNNVKNGDVLGAVIDGAGIIADAAAVALPLIPGGAGTAIKAVRATKATAETLVAAGQIYSGATNIKEGFEKGNDIQLAAGLVQTVSCVKRIANSVNEFQNILQKPLHGNNLNTTKPAEGYSLIDRDSKKIMKYGETTRGNKRYTQKYLDENNVKMNFEAKGSKRAMHDWQHQKILYYKNSNGGARPPLNKSDW